MLTESPLSDEALALLLKTEARKAGFDLTGIAPAARPDTFDQFQRWLANGYHGEMQYLPGREEAYQHPGSILANVRSLLVVGMRYDGPGPPSKQRERATPVESSLPSRGRIAAYAPGMDYHDLFRQRLRHLAGVLRRHRPQASSRGVVDTAPLLERDVARQAGLGWFGKNTMLINRQHGSYFLLGALLTDCTLPPDEPHETDHCGTCTRCLDVCPTEAFPEAGVLDATRCISYLTIELRDVPIPAALRPGVEDWLFGCDLCQQVCPWNRRPLPALAPEFKSRDTLDRPDAAAFLQMSEEEFSDRYSKTPLERPGRQGMARNAAIVLGNLGNPDDVPLLGNSLDDPSSLVRGAVIWALGRIGTVAARRMLERHQNVERDPSLHAELRAALEACAAPTTESC